MSTLRTSLLALLLVAGAAAHAEEAKEPRVIDLAICLDTSGSMNGLLDAARTKIWSIVNDLALAKPLPRLRVAFLTFGNNGHTAESGWVRVHSDLTEDLDLISQEMFAQTTNGGDEYVGRVLQRAMEGLKWDASKSALKLVIVAGNESAEQDPVVNVRDVCRSLIGKGIMVNSIYCGPATDSLAPAWKEVATLADGHFASIDQDRGTVTVATPFDTKLAALSTALNATYVPYGAQGDAGWARQTAQDKKAEEAAPAAAAERAACKVGAFYQCNWCLVDVTREGKVKLAEVKKEDLPEALRGKSLAEIQAHLDEKYAERCKIQADIAGLQKERALFIEAELAKTQQKDDKAFDRAVRDAIRAQATRKGYAFGE